MKNQEVCITPIYRVKLNILGIQEHDATFQTIQVFDRSHIIKIVQGSMRQVLRHSAGNTPSSVSNHTAYTGYTE